MVPAACGEGASRGDSDERVKRKEKDDAFRRQNVEEIVFRCKEVLAYTALAPALRQGEFTEHTSLSLQNSEKLPSKPPANTQQSAAESPADSRLWIEKNAALGCTYT
ncbi:UNVERIFIED_CONTAM: hypothetical protein HHA_450910 [Hammondia hammondi]|eukprot:XP_008883380.1 hypothetical protein HHA_450910 [Hammondia hammondi]